MGRYQPPGWHDIAGRRALGGLAEDPEFEWSHALTSRRPARLQVDGDASVVVAPAAHCVPEHPHEFEDDPDD